MNKDDKILQEILSDEQLKAIEDGKAFAIKTPLPAISNRLFTIVAALIVVSVILPHWVGISYFMYFVAYVATFAWLFCAKRLANQLADIQLTSAVEVGILKTLLKAQQELLNLQAPRDDKNIELSDSDDV